MNEEEFNKPISIDGFSFHLKNWDMNSEPVPRPLFDKDKLNKQMERIKEKAIREICDTHKLQLVREVMWAHDAVEAIGLSNYDGSDEILTTGIRVGKSIAKAYDLWGRERLLPSLKHQLWLSQTSEFISIEKATFHKTIEFDRERLREKFKAEQDEITAKIVAEKMLNGDEEPEPDLPYKNMGLFIPKGVQVRSPNKFSLMRREPSQDKGDYKCFTWEP